MSTHIWMLQLGYLKETAKKVKPIKHIQKVPSRVNLCPASYLINNLFELILLFLFSCSPIP